MPVAALNPVDFIPSPLVAEGAGVAMPNAPVVLVAPQLAGGAVEVGLRVKPEACGFPARPPAVDVVAPNPVRCQN